VQKFHVRAQPQRAFNARVTRLKCAICLLSTFLLCGCYEISPSSGGGQVPAPQHAQRRTDPRDVWAPDGFHVDVVATNLNMPTGITFDDQGQPYVVEAGYCYGEVFTAPRLLRINNDGTSSVIATGDNSGPWNGVAFHDGALYVAEGGEQTGGRIVRIDPDGKITPLIENLPSVGDHHTNGPAIDSDGKLYFSIGTATNSGVVGTDNFQFGWLKRHPEFHDIPAQNIVLSGRNFTSENPLKPGSGDVMTGAYLPFGEPSKPQQIISGHVPCTGGIFRLNLSSQNPQIELVAWGLRNPYGLAIAPDGQLFATENQYDDRGSRPVWGTGDLLWAIKPGTWYGWPDYFGENPLTDADHYAPPGKAAPKFLLAEHPNPPQKPAAILGVHSSACGFDFSRSDRFGEPGEAFIAEFGDMAPGVGKVLGPVGFKVVRVNPKTGEIDDFATNRGDKNGPASLLKNAGLERPIACRFDRAGDALYIVDFGVLTMNPKPHAIQNTGVIWRITRNAQ
jgi:glucose/arabinose dehydrogenase